MITSGNLLRPTYQSQSDAVQARISNTLQLLNMLAIERAPLNAQCEEVAGLIDTSSRGTFTYGSMPIAYDKRTDQQIDSTGALALSRFVAICDSMLTPKNGIWHTLGTDADYLLKNRDVRMWYYKTTRKLFALRYSPISNFVEQNQNIWRSLGAYGNGVMYIDQYIDPDTKRKAFRYLAIPWGEIYLTFNHQGIADGFIRIMRMTAHEAMTFPDWAPVLPQIVIDAAAKNSQQKFTFLHHVCRNNERDPVRLDYKGKPYASYYICQDSRTMLTEGGYWSLPIADTRYQGAPNERNGRSIAMDILPTLKTINSEKGDFLTQGHRAVSPVLLLADEGIANMNMKPGAQNVGGWSEEGHPLVGTLPIGNIQVSEEMMAAESQMIRDAFLNLLFAIAADPKSGTTATEVIERINEKGILIAPTLGRQEPYLGRVVGRELRLGLDMNMFDPMPPALLEARGEYTVQYTSPLAKAARMGEVAGYMRSVEIAKEIANVTGDVSVLDPFDFDVSMPEIAIINGSPEPWMADDNKIAAKRNARAQAAARQEQIQAAPAAAAMIKAQAAAGKAGIGAAAVPTGPASRDLAPSRVTPGGI